MIVFKTYFKIIKKLSSQLSIYLVIFLGLAVLFSFMGSTNQVDKFTQSKTRVAFINNDEHSVLIKNFKDFLEKHSIYVDIEDKTEKLQDALFFREVEYIARIPAGFTTAIMSGKDTMIDKTVVSGSTSSIYTDMLINKYFNTAKLYVKNYKSITQEELVKQIEKDLSVETNVEIMTSGGKAVDTSETENYFNYLAYILISVIILGVSSIMMVFNNLNLKRRNLCSPIRNTSINIQILLGNIVFSIACWGLMIILAFILYKDKMFNINTLYFCINSLVLTLTILSMSFLVGIVIKSKNAQSGISNVLSLGLCFLSGVFVPQNLLGENVLAIAKFTPTYWYVKANRVIGNLTNFSADNLAPVITSLLIELGFAIALVSIALVMSKRKQLRGN